MSTIAELKKKNQFVVDALKSMGVSATMYARPVNGKRNLAMSAQNGTVRIWPGEAVLTVYKDSRKKQLVLNSKESKRSWTDKVTYQPRYYQSDSDIRGQLAQAVRTKWNLNSTDEVSITNMKVVVTKKAIDPYGHDTRQATADAKITRRASNMTFLIGIDEEAPFISQLPKHVTSVSDAHKTLRPDVPNNAVRQGEWFFVPVTDQELTALMEHCIKSYTNLRENARLGDTNHRASLGIEYHQKQYVTGIVYDTAPGRHQELLLDGWFRAVRNNEVVNRSVTNAAPVRRYWD